MKIKELVGIFFLIAFVSFGAGLIYYDQFELPIDSRQMKSVYDYQTYYPELDKEIKEFLSDGVITQWEYAQLNDMVEAIDRKELTDKIQNRHPLRQLKEDIQKEIEETDLEYKIIAISSFLQEIKVPHKSARYSHDLSTPNDLNCLIQWLALPTESLVSQGSKAVLLPSLV